MLFGFWKKTTPTASERAQHSPVGKCSTCNVVAPIVTEDNGRVLCLACTAKEMREYIEAEQSRQQQQSAAD